MDTYTVRAERSGDWWALSVPEVRFAHTQTKRLSRALDVAREALSIVLDVPSDSFGLRLDVVVPWDADKHLKEARAHREQADHHLQHAAHEQREAAVTLVRQEGWTLRDAAEVMGLSYQRVGQLVNGAAALA